MISFGSLLQARFSWMFALALLLGACGGGGGGGGDDPAATLVRVEISPATVSVEIATTQQLTATAVYSDGTTQNVTNTATWTSESPTIASVGNTGVIKGLVRGNTVGSTSVAAMFEGKSVGTTVTVTPATALVRVEISPATVSVALATTRRLTATAVYADGTTENVTSTANWMPESAAVASVGNAVGVKGLLRGNMVGSTSVSATFQGKSVSASVTVTAATPTSLSISPANPFIPDGLTRPLTATMRFSDGTNQDVTESTTWTAASPAVATVSSTGLVTAIDPGSSVVTATALSITQTATVTVTTALATSLTVTPFNPTVPVGGTQQFTATVAFSDSTTRNVTSTATWTSSVAARATISSAGLATARQAGATDIRATALGVTGAVAMTVTDTAVVSIDVTPKDAGVAVGFERAYQATALLNDGTTRDVTTEVSWTSSDAAIATIGNAAADKGVATGVAAGPTTITAQLGEVQGSTVLNVTAVTLTAIGVTPANPSIALGLEQSFTATATFSDLSTQDVTDRVTWVSSDVAVATISNADGSRGRASSVTTGTTTVSASIGPTTGQTLLTVADAALTAIEISPINPIVAKGLTQQFTATGTFTDEIARDITDSVTWSSSSLAVATISNDAGAMTQGRATAVQTGTTTISAARNGITSTATLRVTAAVLQTIAVTPADPSVPAGTVQAFTATGTYSDATTADLTGLVTWASSTPAVATISNFAGTRGRANAMAVGTTTISATSISGVVVGSTLLTVAPAVLQSIAVTPETSTVVVGGTRQLTATGTYSDGTTRNITTEVTWTVIDLPVASVSNAPGSQGLVTSSSAGTATITATDPGTMVDGVMTLTVVTALLTEIRVTPANATLPVGFARKYAALGVYSNGTEQDITTQVLWTSTAPLIASVSNAADFKGVVSGIAVGTSTIRATLADGAGTNIVGQTGVTATAATLTSIAVTPGSALRPVGATQQFVAVGTFSDGSTLPITEQVTWASSEASVATISNQLGTQGLATVIAGLLPITTTISATRGPGTATASLSRGLL